MMELNQQLKDDNQSLLTQLEKFTKRIKQLEREVAAE